MERTEGHNPFAQTVNASISPPPAIGVQTLKFRLALTKGQDPHGNKQLNRDMPRWNIGNEDLADLITYLKTLP